MKKTVGFIIFITLVGIFACNKDTEDVTSDVFTQASAEEWFNSTFKKSGEWQDNAESQNKIPDWSNGSYLKKDGLEIFEFPLVENKAMISVPADKTITSNETKKILDATLSRMVIIKINTNEIIVRKLYYVPEYNYLLSKGYDISNVMLNKTNDDFTGLLITKKWNDEVLSNHQVKNGKIKEMLVKYDENTLKDNSLSSIKINNYSTAKTSGLGDEQNLDDVIVNNNYHAPVTYVYLPSQPYYPTTGSSYNPYGTSGGGGGGGGGGGTSPVTAPVIKYILINKNKLCGTYNFKTVGNASVVNISGLGFSASSPSGDKVLAELATVCVTIPNYNLPITQSSTQFNIAWTNTMNELMVYLNNTSGIINPTPTKLRGLILQFLTTNLNYSAGLNSGVSIITGTCPGVPFSAAVYCN